MEGELYEVDDKMLDFCDMFEEHPHVYERVKIDVTLTQGKLILNINVFYC